MSDWRYTPESTALVVIDVQERLMAAMPRRSEMISAVDRLIRAAQILQLPTIVTLQYVRGLGPICPELVESTAGIVPIEKMSFSCCGSEDFALTLAKANRRNILLCGVEAHVCVQQTALDLIVRGHSVSVLADAVCSRRDTDYSHALNRLRDGGVIVTTVEAVIFELLGQAGTPQFKQVLPLFK